MHLPRFLLTPLLIIGVSIPLLASPALAQNSEILITLTAPEWMQDTFNDTLLSEFEAQNPGVNVEWVTSGESMYFDNAASAPDEYFENAAEYAAKADVLFVDDYTLTPEGTRAGMFLDLSPLTSSDATLYAEDFFPAAWESFQWDGGVWALPQSMSLNVMIYNKSRFDEAGLAYPNEAWTIDDFAAAARALSITDSSGAVTMPAFLDWGSAGLLLRGLLGEGVYDNSTIPNSINLQNPELEHLLTVWSELVYEGHTGSGFASTGQDVPMRIDGLYALGNGMISFTNSTDEWAASLLPGGVAGIRPQGFAVSAGTQYPEQAYALIKFLTSSADVSARMFGDSPARQSLVGVEGDNSTEFSIELSETALAIRDQALAVALPSSELRFMDYVSLAITNMDPSGENLDAATALDEAEASANAILQAADEWRASNIVIVAQPTPRPVLSEGEVAINFAYQSFILPLPNREQWETIISDFVAADPQVGQIEFSTDLDNNDDAIDCYVQPYNAVPELELQTVRNLDPFTNDDPAFDRDDFLTGVLEQVTRDDMMWSLPMYIQPEALWYDSERLSQAGVQLPENGWTIEQFVEALHLLRANPDDEAPFVPGMVAGNSYILLLAAAFGGAPIDYRVNPPAINFTDPANVDALRQVLDLVKDGYIDYNALGSTGGISMIGEGNNPLIYSEPLNMMGFRMGPNASDTDIAANPYRFTTFPRGTQYTALNYAIGGGYINATSPNPDACYRWLSYLANHPELFNSMPARRAALSTTDNTGLQSDNMRAVFDTIDTLLQDPSTIVIPSQFGGGGFAEGSYFLSVWLNRALDAYVLEDADLEAELGEAELLATAYMECISTIERISQGQLRQMDQDAQIAYTEQFMDCAISIDPTMESMFAPAVSARSG